MFQKDKVIVETVHGVTVYTQETSVAGEVKWYDGEDKAFKDGAFSAEEQICNEAALDMTGWTVDKNVTVIYNSAYGCQVDRACNNHTGGTIFVEDKYRDADEVINNPDVFIEPEKFKFLKWLSQYTTVVYRVYVKNRDLVFEWVINNIEAFECNFHRNVKIKDRTMACGYSYENRIGLYKDDAYKYTKGGSLIAEPRTKSCRGYPIPKKVALDFKRLVWDKNVINNL